MKRFIAVLIAFLLCVAQAEPLMPGAVFSALDALKRPGTALAVLGPETLGSERSSISALYPVGFREAWYDEISGYLWNRCHLIGAQLAPDTERIENLFTGTRYLNVSLMLPVENQIADYIRASGNHVIYRVTPEYWDDELICRSVTLSVYSIEDDSLRFVKQLENIQPGIVIDYSNGFSGVGDSVRSSQIYILNISSRRFHLPSCPGAASMSERNRQVYMGSREELIRDGYMPCGSCNP